MLYNCHSPTAINDSLAVPAFLEFIGTTSKYMYLESVTFGSSGMHSFTEPDPTDYKQYELAH